MSVQGETDAKSTRQDRIDEQLHVINAMTACIIISLDRSLEGVEKKTPMFAKEKEI